MIRVLTFLLVCSCISTYGQKDGVHLSGDEACELNVEFEDRVSYRVYEVEGKIIADGLHASITKIDKKTFLYLVYHKDLGCVNSKSYVSLSLVGGSDRRLYHSGKDDCRGSDALFVAEIGMIEATELQMFDVVKIKLKYEESEIILDNDIPNYLSQSMLCLRKSSSN